MGKSSVYSSLYYSVSVHGWREVLRTPFYKRFVKGPVNKIYPYLQPVYP